MSLYVTLNHILQDWFVVFPQKRSFDRAIKLAFCSLCTFGRRTISRAICFSGFDDMDWTADYRLFSRVKWKVEDLFSPILKRAVNLVDNELIAIGFDDTVIKKKGKKIPGTRWLRDSLSPVFNVNIIWGMRFLQASVLVPLYNKDKKTPPRAIPIQFKPVPPVKKPKRNAPKEEWEAYEIEKKTRNLSFYFIEALTSARNELDKLGFENKKLLAVVDGSFCNKNCMNFNLINVDIIARARKNAGLCFKLKKKKGKRFYQKKMFTPEDVRLDKTIAWNEATAFHSGNWRDIRYKEIEEVYWKTGTKMKPVRLIVIAPTPYRLTKTGKLYYRDPAYLLTTDLTTDTLVLIQKYLDRWQIEVNFREEKNDLGLGQAQVRSDESVNKQPAFVVASYAALLLASIELYQDKRVECFISLPKWRRKPSLRPSCLDLLNQLREEIIDSRKNVEKIGIKKELESQIFKMAA
jgi:hypothetical protein